MVVLVGVLAGCGGDPSQEPTPACDAYVACSAAVDPDDFGTVLDAYGPDGSCWSDPETADTCDSACVSGLEEERAESTEAACWETAADCDVLEGAAALCDTVAMPLECGRDDEACQAQVVRDCPDDAYEALANCAQGEAGVLLVVDFSDSMVQELVAASGAAAPFLDALPAGTPVAVVSLDAAAEAGAPFDPVSVAGDGAGDLRDQLGCTTCAGSAAEEGLESAWLALCRTQPTLDPACLDTELLTSDDADTLPDLATVDIVHVVILSDEGDSSRRLDQQDVATLYTDLFETLPLAVRVHAIVPGLDGGEVTCPGVATDWGVSRYLDAVDRTLGTAHDVFDSTCETGDIERALLDIAGTL